MSHFSVVFTVEVIRTELHICFVREVECKKQLPAWYHFEEAGNSHIVNFKDV
jgi:hypothetical protein